MSADWLQGTCEEYIRKGEQLLWMRKEAPRSAEIRLGRRGTRRHLLDSVRCKMPLHHGHVHTAPVKGMVRKHQNHGYNMIGMQTSGLLSDLPHQKPPAELRKQACTRTSAVCEHEAGISGHLPASAGAAGAAARALLRGQAAR